MPASVVDSPCEVVSQAHFLGFRPTLSGLCWDAQMKSAVVFGAGGVVFNANADVLLIQYPDSRGGGWAFAKGHIEPGETPEVAALREVLEETGVRAEIAGSLESTRYVNPKGVAREIFWFAMRTSETSATPEPGFQAGFFAQPAALGLLTHAGDRRLLEQAKLLMENS